MTTEHAPQETWQERLAAGYARLRKGIPVYHAAGQVEAWLFNYRLLGEEKDKVESALATALGTNEKQRALLERADSLAYDVFRSDETGSACKPCANCRARAHKLEEDILALATTRTVGAELPREWQRQEHDALCKALAETAQRAGKAEGELVEAVRRRDLAVGELAEARGYYRDKQQKDSEKLSEAVQRAVATEQSLAEAQEIITRLRMIIGDDISNFQAIAARADLRARGLEAARALTRLDDDTETPDAGHSAEIEVGRLRKALEEIVTAEWHPTLSREKAIARAALAGAITPETEQAP